MEKKMTYVQALDKALAVVTDEAVKERLTALRATIQKRNTADKKPTKEQKANAVIKADILVALADRTARTVTEIMEVVPSLEGASNQKASALVNQLVKEGSLKRTEVKRKAYFSLA